MKIKILYIIFIFTVVNACGPNQIVPNAIDVTLLSDKVRPQDDFYNFVNSKWIEDNEIPDDKTRWGVTGVLRENTAKDLLSILNESASNDYTYNDSDEAKAVLFFNLIKDTISRNRLGVKSIKPFIERIKSISSITDLQVIMEDYLNLGLGSKPFISFSIFSDLKDSNKNALYLSSGQLGLQRDYYINNDDDSKNIISKYEKHIARMFILSGFNNDDAISIASNVLSIEKQIAMETMDKVERRDPNKIYNPRSIEELSSLSKSIKWNQYFINMGISNLENLIVDDLDYIKSLDKILNTNPVNYLKDYMLWCLIDVSASILTTEMDRANWDFYSKTLRGAKRQEPFDQSSMRVVNSYLPEPLGKLYVAKKFPPKAKDQIIELVDNLVIAYKKRIDNLTWMDESTKLKAFEKLEKIKYKVGYPDKWEDFSLLNISKEETKSYFDAFLRIRKFYLSDEIAELDEPVDKSKWFMSPQTVNAYYSPLFNEIGFPAAILQPPFFNYNADAAVNYGAIGAVIGHEISHGFDDSGADFDANGNLVNWWSENDLVEFNNLGDKLAEQYSSIEVLPDVFINGKFTLGENIGDLGGVHAAYDALEIHHEKYGKPDPIDGYSADQRFFIAYARSWRSNTREQSLRNQIKSDPHSPGYNRGNQPLKNMDEFYSAFKIEEADSMYLEPSKRVYIW